MNCVRDLLFAEEAVWVRFVGNPKYRDGEALEVVRAAEGGARRKHRTVNKLQLHITVNWE